MEKSTKSPYALTAGLPSSSEPAPPSPGAPSAPNSQIPGGFANPTTHYAVPEHFNFPSHVDDWTLQPGRPLHSRYRKVAELIALGKSDKQIGEDLGYEESRVAQLRQYPQIRTAVERFHYRFLDAVATERLRELGPDAIYVIEEMLCSPSEKLRDKTETAKWVIEKLTGKARQEIEHNAGSNILELLKQLRRTHEALALPSAEPPEIELVQTEKEPEDPLERWVSENVPEGK